MFKKTLLLCFLSLLLINLSYAQENPKIKFGIISDIHPDVMHDGTERLQSFIDNARKEKVDFIIHLGDFCQPRKENLEFMNMWLSFERPQYSTIGNHDSDGATKDDFIKFANMPSRYYSFDKGGIHFVVLDANNVVEKKRNAIDPQQLEWLKNDIAKTKNRCVIFSHQNLYAICGNSDQVKDVLEQENKNAGFTKVIAAMSGHEHSDYVKEIGGIAYIQINSSSYIWVGEPSTKEYVCEDRYTPEINAQKPYLKKVIPYEKAVYGIVTINKKGLKIKGVESKFVEPVKGDMAALEEMYEMPLVPRVSDVFIPIK